MLDFINESLDQIALAVSVFVVRDGLRSRAARWDHGLGAPFCGAGAKTIRVINHISQQLLEREPADQVFGLENVVRLPRGQDEADGIAKSIHADVDLRTQAAARMPDPLILAPPFFAPAACWCARTMVESMMRYSKSGNSINASKSRFQTPFFAHRRKRWNTLFQLPNSWGRSRHGAPARAIQSTASTNQRLSSPCRPLSPSLPGIRGSMRRQCASVSARRIKIALLSCDLESHSRLRGNPLYVNRT